MKRNEQQFWIRKALWHLDDRIWLKECPLACLPWVVSAARNPPWRGRFFAEGLVVQDRLRAILEAVVVDYGPHDIMAALAQARLREGRNAEVAERFGFTAEHICRKYFRDLVDGVTEKFFDYPKDAAA